MWEAFIVSVKRGSIPPSVTASLLPFFFSFFFFPVLFSTHNLAFFSDRLALDYCADSTLNNCSTKAECEPLIGGFVCTCLPGYSGNGVNCTSICLSPFTRKLALSTKMTLWSVDIDECLPGGENTCHSNATCIDIPGSFICSCKAGFYGSGAVCSGDYLTLLMFLPFLLFHWHSLFRLQRMSRRGKRQ